MVENSQSKPQRHEEAPFVSREAKRVKATRGFAAMDPQRQRDIASEGGRAAHEQGKAHKFTAEEAREAGRKGGMASGVARALRSKARAAAMAQAAAVKTDSSGDSNGNQTGAAVGQQEHGPVPGATQHPPGSDGCA